MVLTIAIVVALIMGYCLRAFLQPSLEQFTHAEINKISQQIAHMKTLDAAYAHDVDVEWQQILDNGRTDLALVSKELHNIITKVTGL